MKKMLICAVLCSLVLACGVPAAQCQEAAPELSEDQQAQLKQQLDILRANIAAMRAKQARVAVLRQLLEEELSDLRQMQAVFCDQYNLSLEKFRAGLYRFNEETNRFEELSPKPVEPAAEEGVSPEEAEE